MTTYDKFPTVAIKGYDDSAWQGWEAITRVLEAKTQQRSRTVLVMDCYPGVRMTELEENVLPRLRPTLAINAEQARRDEGAIHEMLARNLTDVFGVLSCHQPGEFFDAARLKTLQEQVNQCTEGLIVIYGPGATLVHPGDVLVYADLPRWEIQQRMRSGEMGNWGAENQRKICFVATSAPFLSSGASSTATKRRCSGAPIFYWIQPRRTSPRWSAARPCEPG